MPKFRKRIVERKCDESHAIIEIRNVSYVLLECHQSILVCR